MIKRRLLQEGTEREQRMNLNDNGDEARRIEGSVGV